MPVSAANDTQLIPLEVLFGNPVKASPQISPDGKRIAYLAPSEGVLNVWVQTIGEQDDRAVTSDRDRGIQSYFWAKDSKNLLYVQDAGGNENWRLYAIDPDKGKTRDLTPFENVQVRIVAVNKRVSGSILIGMNKDNPEVHDVYKLEIKTGKLEMVAKNPGGVSQWIADYDMKVRGAMRMLPEGGSELLIRENETSEWKPVAKWGVEDESASGPVGFTMDGKQIYLQDSRGFNTGRLVKLDLTTFKREVIIEDAEYDIEDVVINPDTRKVQLVAFVKERTEWHVLDSAIKEDIDVIRSTQDGDFFIASRDKADANWIVGFVIDDGPVAYYAYHRQYKKMEFLFENRPDLNEYTLAPMEPVKLVSRDGLSIHGYITFPPNVERKNLPMVLNVHGGPWVRDTWGYDPEAQWLANRGYACLQVNYRGSTGYGKQFVNAGDKEWGGKMHDDLVDAVQWAVSQGWADSKRVAIYGGSYGGYAALAGATFTPDLFACAVDLVGPSSLITFIKTIPPYWSLYLAQFHKQVGNPDTEAEFLQSRSPLFHVDKIKIPMLIAQGANDPRVKQAESEQVVEAMRSKGIDCQYMLFPDEGHGFAKPENRIKFYRACEHFFAKHLGGRIEDKE